MKKALEKEIDEILLDYCTNEKCKELSYHRLLKHVVRERLLKMVNRLITPIHTCSDAVNKTITEK